MADISDVTAYLTTAATTAVYPSGTSQPSVAAIDCRIYEGWPNPSQLDLDVAGNTLVNGVPTARTNGPLANVSIFPMLGMNSTPYQILDQTYTIVPATYGLTVVSFVSNVLTVSGTPTTGEYLTLIIDGATVISQTGATLTALLAALAAQAVSFGYTASSTATTLTITPNTSKTAVVRQGAVATLGKVTHRQKQSVMVSIWAPTHAVRTTLSAAIDNYIKQFTKVSMPDTSQAIVCFNRTNVIDEQQTATIYRRDLIYDVEYATVFEFPGYVITTVNTTIAAPATAHAIT